MMERVVSFVDLKTILFGTHHQASNIDITNDNTDDSHYGAITMTQVLQEFAQLM